MSTPDVSSISSVSRATSDKDKKSLLIVNDDHDCYPDPSITNTAISSCSSIKSYGKINDDVQEIKKHINIEDNRGIKIEPALLSATNHNNDGCYATVHITKDNTTLGHSSSSNKSYSEYNHDHKSLNKHTNRDSMTKKSTIEVSTSQCTDSTSCSYSISTSEEEIKESSLSSYPHISICDNSTNSTTNNISTTSTTHDNNDEEYILLSVASIIIQTFYKRYIARKKYSLYKKSIITLQSHARGWIVRDNLYIDIYCATQIQRVVRGFLDRVRYNYIMYCVLLIQSFVRRRIKCL